MTIQAIDNLQLAEVQFHGVPNQERIAIYVRNFCDLGEYCLLLAMPAVEGNLVPIKDHMLWFGHGLVNPGDWIFVYTASGTTTVFPGQLVAGAAIQPRIINMHWGKNQTIFQNRAVTPLLIQIGASGGLPQPIPAFQGKIGPPDVTQKLY